MAPRLNSDGTLVFQTQDDLRAEREAAALLERAWRCNIRPYPMLHPVDWFAERDGRMVAHIEFRVRDMLSTDRPSVFLSYAKYDALLRHTLKTYRPSLYVVRFNDGIRWINVQDIDMSLQGYRLSVKRAREKELRHPEVMLDVPIADMRPLREG